MLKWEATPSTYRFADCEFGRYQIIGRGGRRLRVTDPVGCVLIHHEHRSIADAKAWAEADYAARVGRIASANGYVKLGDDEIVVKRGTLNALIDDHCADCTFDSFEIHDCDNCDLKPIRDRLKSEEGK